MIRLSRITAVSLSVAILGWQVWNASKGAFLHRFLVADLIVAVMLIVAAAWPGDRRAAIAMIAAFSATAGVFLAATTGAILIDGYSMGRLLTGVGLLPCAICVAVLTRSLMHPKSCAPSPRS